MKGFEKWADEEFLKAESEVTRIRMENPERGAFLAYKNMAIELACQRNALRDALGSTLGMIVCFIGPDDELGQAHIKVAREALEKCK